MHKVFKEKIYEKNMDLLSKIFGRNKMERIVSISSFPPRVGGYTGENSIRKSYNLPREMWKDLQKILEEKLSARVGYEDTGIERMNEELKNSKIPFRMRQYIFQKDLLLYQFANDRIILYGDENEILRVISAIEEEKGIKLKELEW